MLIAIHHAAPALHHVHYVQLGGFIFAIVAIFQAIFSFAVQIGKWVLEAGDLIFKSIDDVAKFAAKGVIWLTGHIRNALADVFSGFKNVFEDITSSLKDLWSKVSDFFGKVKAFLQPVTDFIKKVRDLYDHYWNVFVKPVLNVISRIRKALAIFKFFHLQWAQKLDTWLADIQQQIIKNTLWLHQQLTMVINWVNAVSDPYGFMRVSPILGGFVNGLDQFWTAITGSRFFGVAGFGGGGGITTSAKNMFASQTDDLKNKTGDAGDVFDRAGAMRDALRSEMGVG